MDDISQLKTQISDINQKLDLLLDFMHEQKLKATRSDDLIADLALVGKDMYDTAVSELENYSVELDPEQLKLLTVKLLRNIPTFIRIVDMMESMTDLAKDAGPMVNEMIIDFTRKLHELEQRGYFTFIREAGKTMDKAVRVYSTMESQKVPDYTWWQLIRELRSPEIRRGMSYMVTFAKGMAKPDLSHS